MLMFDYFICLVYVVIFIGIIYKSNDEDTEEEILMCCLKWYVLYTALVFSVYVAIHVPYATTNVLRYNGLIFYLTGLAIIMGVFYLLSKRYQDYITRNRLFYLGTKMLKLFYILIMALVHLLFLLTFMLLF